MQRIVVVTGSPASGKSTLSAHLQSKLPYQFLSRDDVKQSLLLELEQSHESAGDTINQVASQRFFELATQMIEAGQDVLLEAAFQHKIWSRWLETAAHGASLRLIVCKVPVDEALRRYDARQNSERVYFHGDNTIDAHQLIREYQPPMLQAPTLNVNSVGEYAPGLNEIIQFSRG